MRRYDLLTNSEVNPAAAGTSAGASLAQFWDLRGIKVCEYGGIYWTHYRGPIYASFPNTIGVAPEPGEMNDILRRGRMPGVRVPSNGNGLSCNLHVAIPSEYGILSVVRNHRCRVKRGLARCEMRLIDTEQLQVEGFALNIETMARQKRNDPEFTDPKQWAKFTRAVRDCPECFVTGAFVDGRLSAYMVSCRDGAWLRHLYKMSRTDDLVHCVNYALDYHTILQAAQDSSIRAVENGFSAIVGESGVDRYKKHIGYIQVPVRLSVYFHPLLSPLATSRPAVAIARSGASRLSRPGVQVAAQVFEAARETKLTSPETFQKTAYADCQQEDSRLFSRLSRPYPVILAGRLFENLSKHGPSTTFRKLAVFAGHTIHPGKKKSVRRPTGKFDEILGLQSGDWVEVRSEAEVLATLDGNNKMRGLLFTDEMRLFYGRRFRVLKRVENIYLEESRQNRKIRNTVILEGAHCSGAAVRCDRACFHLWREAWLKRAVPAEIPRDHLIQLGSESRMPICNGNSKSHAAQ